VIFRLSRRIFFAGGEGVRSATRTGRVIGALLVVQLAGFIVPFILLHPLQRLPGFLENAAPASFQIKLAVFWFFANGALTIGIAIITLPIFRQYSQPMWIGLFASSLIMFLLQAVDNAHLLSMVALSQDYLRAGAANGEVFQAAAIAAGATRKWTHYSELLAIDMWMFIFYGMLWRPAIVPRLVAALALLTVGLHTAGISLPLLLGYQSVMMLGVPMAFGQMAAAVWLIAKGFKTRETEALP
jgi:Domain of unknown function (DUF4386)